MLRKRRIGLENNRNKFKELLGDDITFFNKIDTKPQHREQSLDHEDECECNVCKIKALRLRGDKNRGGNSG